MMGLPYRMTRVRRLGYQGFSKLSRTDKKEGLMVSGTDFLVYSKARLLCTRRAEDSMACATFVLCVHLSAYLLGSWAI